MQTQGRVRDNYATAPLKIQGSCLNVLFVERFDHLHDLGGGVEAYLIVGDVFLNLFGLFREDLQERLLGVEALLFSFHLDGIDTFDLAHPVGIGLDGDRRWTAVGTEID